MKNDIIIIFISAVLSALLCLHPALAQRNVQVNNPADTDPEEVAIAVNPVNPLNLVAGANINYAFWSTDGGMTWAEQRLTGKYGVWGDPMVIFDAAGNAFFGHLSNPTAGHWIDRIVVQKSADGGMTWDGGIGVGLNGTKHQDKHWIVADNTSSPYRGAMYVSWTEFDKYGSKSPGDSSRILFSGSSDNGATWSNPVTVSDEGGDCIDSDGTTEGAVPAVGPNGAVYVCWANKQGLMFDKSADGGRTWGRDKFVTTQSGGWDHTVSGLQRCNGLPVTLCDQGYSKYAGTIYIVWGDQRNGADNTDVFVITSTDGGETWSQITRVNNDASRRHQFMPAAALDPVTGHLWIVYYDRRNTTGNATDVYAAVSADAGRTFTTMPVSDKSFTPESGTFFGDYIGIAAYGSKAHPIWMRQDGDRLSVWTQTLSDSGISATVAPSPAEAPVNTLSIVPNPSRKIFNITFWLLSAGRIHLGIYNSNGAAVRTLSEETYERGSATVQWDGTNRQGVIVPRGNYYCRLIAPDGEAMVKMIVKR